MARVWRPAAEATRCAPRAPAARIWCWRLGIGGEAERLAVEAQLRLERVDDRLGLAEAVSLALVRVVLVQHTAAIERLDDHLGLVGRDDHVFEPLEDDHGRRDLVDGVDRRALVHL